MRYRVCYDFAMVKCRTSLDNSVFNGVHGMGYIILYSTSNTKPFTSK